ncbi:MAG TPA: ATP-binding protein [Gemmatimonadales bacterium]|nr:ATP-binding protein [Gemmatimonadales bacterium]
METIGQLAGGIAHDFNNMLSIVMANTELVAAALPPESEEAAAELRDVRDAANRGKALVRQLMAFSRVGTLEPEAIDLGALALRVARMLQRMLPATVSVECVVDPGLDPAWADPGAVEQLVLNLSTNARDAMPHGGRLIISVQAATARDVAQQSPDVRADGYLCLTVTDTGTGMDAATLQRMFDPFFTTKPPGKGTGLGLAMVRGIMEQHGGFVRITSEVGRGTSARLCFPVARGAVPDRASETAHPGERALRGTETVLVVEDEEALRRAVQRMLERYGYTVLTAEDGEIALEMLRRGTPHADLILTDLIMPHMGGIELYDRVMRELGPRRFLIVSGYSPVEAPSSGGPPVGVPFIRKPWTLVEVLEAVRKTLDAEIT